MKTQPQLAFLIIVITLAYGQMPCNQYEYNEIGCVSSTYEACSWNDFLSSCQQTYSSNIGCSVTLNKLACISQIQYPDQVWAYCIFSGYCQDVSDGVADCLPTLSKPACLAVVGKACLWANQCLEMTQQQLSSKVQEASNNIEVMNQSNILVCQLIDTLPVMHQQGAYQYLIKLVETYNSDPAISGKYQNLLLVPGCLEVDANILNLIKCSDAGVNSVACSKITTPGLKCQFINKSCQYVTDVSTLNCYDSINKEACLSVTNIKQPCYWSNNKCLLYGGVVSCSLPISPVSPSFCAAAASQGESQEEQECFFYAKKQKCSQLCRSTALQANKKGCNQSNYGCIYQNNTCLFKGLKSQCGLIGQNKQSCMNVNENCQFVGGFCKIMTDLSIAKCTDNLNKQACINLTKIGQLCQYNSQSKQCQFIKVNYWNICIDYINVNENVCKIMPDSACYWNNGNCQNADTNISCTAKGLNRIGCLASTQSQCQWNENSGSCQNVVMSNTTQCSSLKLVNEYTCKMVSYKYTNSDNVEINELCKYNDQTYSCETFVADLITATTYKINCLTPGLNKVGCLSIVDPTIACRWTSTGCVQITSVSSSCSGLMGVTAKVCALAVGDPCTYDAKLQRCTTSVEKYPATCTSTTVLNGQGCSFIEPKNGGKCYFNSKTLSCLETTSTVLSNLDCAKSYPNKQACLTITTVGQRCQWNIYKLQCEQLKTPYINWCDELTNVGVNGCKAYEDNVNYYIDYYSYCTDGDTANTCKLFDLATPNANCFSAANPNLHACVSLTSDQNCYFDTSLLKCTTMNAGQENILLSILCKQGNKNLCNRIKTQDQFCIWDDEQNKCYHQDLCSQKYDKTECAAVTQPCIFKDSQCILILSTNAINYECTDAVNELACYQVALKSCTYNGSACIELTQDLENDTCTTYSDKKVNALACAKITKLGEYCSYDRMNNKCISNNITTYDLCNIGQNEQNCNYDNNCTFSPDKSICSSISSVCTNALTLDDCMSTKDTCMWTTANLCKYVPYDGTCTLYQTPGYKYSTYTCGSVWASDDKKICAQIPDSLLCEEIIPFLCSQTTDRIDCTNVRNKCTYNSTLKLCALTLANPKKCSDNYTKFACLTGKLKCVWDLGNLACNDYNDEEISCQTINDDGTINDEVRPTLSAQICYINECYLDLNTLGCTIQATPTTCAEAKSPQSCHSLPDEQYCYWDTDMICKKLADLNKGANLTYGQVSYSQKTLCLLPEQEGQQTIWWEEDQTCYMPDNAGTTCIHDLNIRACQAVENDYPAQYCVFKDKKCQNADLNSTKCSDTVNFDACISIATTDQYCVWLGQRCAFVDDDGYAIGKYSTVNMNTCKKTYTINGIPNSSIQNPLGVKFSIDGCVLSEPDTDICSTPGLNYYGCLQSIAGSCTWNGKNCVNFVKFDGKKSCSDFQMVSAGVCIMVQGLKCTWKDYNCIDATTSQQCTDNLSQAACVVQVTNSCKWENNKCQNQKIIVGVTQCGSGDNLSTSLYSSIYSCQQIQYGVLPCRHNGQGCTTEIDLLITKCNTPGLNSVACTMVKLQKCIFLDGKCQSYIGSSQQCRSLIAVSPQVCADVTDSAQYCKYSRLTNKCTIVNTYDLCTSIGINQSGCSSLYNCKWHKDQNYCGCGTSLQGLKFCADFDKDTCKGQQQCLIDQNNCRAKVCSDLGPQNCQGSKINNSYCYFTQTGICASAQTCNDVRDVNDCTKIQINGSNCYTHIQGFCREPKCSDNLTDATCNGNCFWLGTYCDNRVCQQFGKKEQCQGTYNNNTCFWINNMCFGLSSCYELAKYYDDQISLQSICNSSTINGDKCHWQLQSQYSNLYECSHNQCNPLGSSKLNCVGAEIDNFVCILSYDFQCKRCEDIVNECECQDYKGNCLYTNKKCRSIKCLEYQETQCDLFPDKCMWHSNSQKCLVVCSKLSESDCQTRNTQTSQCYWESKLKRCNTGQQPVINIDTAQVQIQAANITVTVQTTGSVILTILLYIII